MKERKSFAEILKAIMQEKKLNQVTLSEALGICQSRISNLLNGKNLPTYRTMLLFIDRLGMKPEELF